MKALYFFIEKSNKMPRHRLRQLHAVSRYIFFPGSK